MFHKQTFDKKTKPYQSVGSVLFVIIFITTVICVIDGKLVT